MKITKKNGSIVLYEDEKLVNSILRANEGTEEELTPAAAAYLSDVVIGRLVKEHDTVSTALIRDAVYRALCEHELWITAQQYREYEKSE